MALQYPFTLDRLPLDYSEGRAKKIQDALKDRGHVWLSTNKTSVYIFSISKGEVEKPEALRTHYFTDEQRCRLFLSDLDPSLSHVLVIICSADPKPDIMCAPRPCISVPLVADLCFKFQISPVFIGGLSNDPSFSRQGMQQVVHDTEVETLDICYNSAIPWVDGDSSNTIWQHRFASVTAYVKLQDRLPSCTVFCNVSNDWVAGVKAKWLESLALSKKERGLFLLDHYELFSAALDDLQSGLKLQEALHLLHGELRLETHMESPYGDIQRTIKNVHGFLNTINGFVSALDMMEHTLKSLRKETYLDAIPDGKSSRLPHAIRWNENLLSMALHLKSRSQRLITRMREVQSTIYTFIALRDSKTLSHNTEEMTQMARATEASGKEVQAMTRRMEEDAKQMKFLSEITAVFLPITAIATVFSMGFFTIDSSSAGYIPTLPSFRFVWLYFVVSVPISTLVFSYWGYKRHRLAAAKPSASANDEEAEQISGTDAMDVNGLLGRRSDARARVEQTAATLKQAMEERRVSEEQGGEVGYEETVEEKRKKGELEGKLFTELLLAQREFETAGGVR